MIYNHSFDISVRVLFGHTVVPYVLLQEVIEEELDLCTASQLSLHSVAPTRVVLTTNGVSECNTEFRDHLPKQLDLLMSLDWHRWAQFFQLALCFFYFLGDLTHYFRQIATDVSEENPHQLVGKRVTAQQLWRKSGVYRMIAEVFSLLVQCFLDAK